MPEITYYHDNKVVTEENTELTLLDISVKHKINHMQACGGKGRCSTCRVLILKNTNNLEPMNETERRIALEKGFENNVRIACQTKITGPVTIKRLVLDNKDYSEIRERRQSTTGREDNLAILFSDIRSFTSFSEKQLPYDIIHVLNRYFQEMGESVLNNGGYLDKYIGDGLMANFGLKQTDPKSICLRAVNAALDMLQRLKKVNEYLRNHLNHEFRIGIGIHYGNVIVGELGHHSNASFTLIGDNVNIASRVESMTKKAKAELLVSEQVMEHIKGFVQIGRKFKAPLKGKTGFFRLYEITNIDQSIVDKYIDREVTLRLLAIDEIAEGTYQFRFAKPAAFKFIPGQFTDLYFLDQGEKETRTLSISSSPTESEVRFVTRNTKSEFKKKLLSLSYGEQVGITEPMGNLILRTDSSKKHVLLAGGIGVTPFYSIIRHEFDSNADCDLLLLSSNRDLQSSIFHEEFVQLDEQFTGFTYRPTLTKAVPTDWPFEQGYIDLTMLKKYIPNLHQSIYYITGTQAFVDKMQETLQAEGIAQSNICLEEFYGY
ncbi:MAG: adenylate/guanylate cyclase domain-containing protein [Spirochaetota bacterium]